MSDFALARYKQWVTVANPAASKWKSLLTVNLAVLLNFWSLFFIRKARNNDSFTQIERGKIKIKTRRCRLLLMILIMLLLISQMKL